MYDEDRLIDELIGREGGYSNHPADRGGPTRWGVTEQVARAYGYRGDMRQYPREEAVRVYRLIYWSRPGFDDVALRYPRLAAELLDTGVNMGPGIAAGFLQVALNALNRQARDYGDILVDRAIGPVTLLALDGFKRVRGARGEMVLLKAVESQQGARYLDITGERPANEAFTYGWFDHRIGQAL